MSPGALVHLGRCPACGSRRREALFHSHDWIYQRPGDFLLMRCRGCGCVYPDPRPAPDALAGFYPEDGYYAYTRAVRHRLFARRSVPARAWYAIAQGVLHHELGYAELGGWPILGATVGRLPLLHEWATFRQGPLLHPWVPHGALLDVGCGAGGYLDLMRALGWSRVVGVDVSAAAVHSAREGLGLEAHRGDLREVALPDNSFDAITLSHTLEHVDEPAAVLAEVRRVARPNGRVAIAVPNVTSLVSRLLREHWLGLETPRHLINFSPIGLRAAVERSGLRIESLFSSARGSRGVALFSISRALGDPHHVYTDDQHRFPWRRRALASGLATVEMLMCAARLRAGELLYAVARA